MKALRDRTLCRRACITLLLAAPALFAGAASAGELRVATVPILMQGGFLPRLLATFGARRALELKYRAAPVKALETGRFDVLLAHQDSFKVRKLQATGLLGAGTPVLANSIAFLGPHADPAGVAQARSASGALTAIRESGACFVVNALDGLSAMQDALLAAATFSPDAGCLVRDPETSAAAAPARAARLEGYTLWGAHPFVQSGRSDLRAFVPDDPALLRRIAVFAVRGSPRAVEVSALARYLLEPGVQAEAAAFRLDGHPELRLWWPATASRSGEPPAEPSRANAT